MEARLKRYCLASIFFVFILFDGKATVTWEIGATGDYPSIALAWAAMPVTITEPYILEIASDYTTEDLPVMLTPIGGASAANTITIRPQTGVTNLYTTTGTGFAAMSIASVFDFDGADYVILDGRPGGSGTTSEWTIEHARTNISSGIGTHCTVRFQSSATNNEIRYMNIKGSQTGGGNGTTSGGIVREDDISEIGVVIFEGNVGGNSDNLIDNTTITSYNTVLPDASIHSIGAAGNENINNTVSNCNLTEFCYSAIRLDANNDSWTFSGNSIYQDDVDLPTQIAHMIHIADGGNHLVDNNYFGGQAPLCGGSPFTRTSMMKCVYFESSDAGATNTVTNNTFSNFDLQILSNTHTDYPNKEIFEAVYGGGDADFIVGGLGNDNVIGATSGTGSIYVYYGGSVPNEIFRGINMNSNGTSTVTYNTFGSITIAGPTGGGLTRTIEFVSATDGSVNCSNNTFGNTTAENLIFGNPVSFTGDADIDLVHYSGSTSGTCTNNTFQNLDILSASSFLFRGFAIETSATFTVSDNTFQNIDDDGSYYHSAFLANGSGSKTFSNNTIDGWVFNNSVARPRIIYGAGSSNYINSTGNVIENITHNGIYFPLQIGYYTYSYGNFTNNTIQNITSSERVNAFWGYNNATWATMTVSNNIVDNITIDYAASDDEDYISLFQFHGRNSSTSAYTHFVSSNNAISNIDIINASTYDAYIYGVLDNCNSATISSNTVSNVSYTGTDGKDLYMVYVGKSEDEWSQSNNYTPTSLTLTDNKFGDTSADNITITGNNGFYGLYSYSDGDHTLSGNAFQEVELSFAGTHAQVYGIYMFYGTLNSSNDTIREISSAYYSTSTSSGVTANNGMNGVYISSSTGVSTIDRLFIDELDLTNTGAYSTDLYGIYVTGSGGDSITRSDIWHCSNATTTTSNTNRTYNYGIYVTGTGQWDVFNNVVFWDNGGINNFPGRLFGVYATGSGANRWYHNTIQMSGGTGAQYSTPFATANVSNIIKNNVFVNERTGSLAYAIYAVSTSTTTLDNNYLESAGTYLARYGSSNRSNLALWQSAWTGNPTNADNSESDPIGTITIDNIGYVVWDPNLKVADAGEDLLSIVPQDKDAVARDITPWRGAFESTSVLPVELVDFDVIGRGRTVDVYWTTVSETNNDYYEVQRSQDFLNWETIETVDGAGNSTQIIQYEFEDEAPFSGISYYRLKQIDFDGAFTFSEPGAVNFKMEVSSNVYPNPAETITTIVAPNKEMAFNFEIINAQGQSVLSGASNNGMYTQDISELVPGVYFVRITQDSVYNQVVLVVK